MFICEICNREFSSKRSLSSHRNHHDPEYKEKSLKGSKALLSSKAIENRKKSVEQRIYKDWAKENYKCLSCSIKLSFPNRKTCSDACHKKYISKANTRVISEENRKKISETLRNKPKNTKPEKFCIICNMTHKLNRKTCSDECRLIARKRPNHIREGYKLYKYLSAFRFNLSDYPDEFDFQLIEEHGWYKAKNRGDNPNGVSRDHMLSVKYGFENNIDPNIIGHPANCRLMLQKENSSKDVKCSITYNDLIERIEAWDKKYR